VDDLLDLSRMTRGRIELRKSRIPLSLAVNDALETCRPQLGERRHRVELDLATEPLFVEADRLRLAQVFTNLISNACKYQPHGGEIRIATRREGDTAVATIRDAGIGIPSDALPHIFDMFSQAIRSRDLAEGGLGIGLSLVRGIVEQHGGHVVARSEGPGKGSEFVVTLHASRADAVTEPSQARRPEIKNPRRVLVADDNHDSADSLAAMLALMGHDALAVYDGAAAVDRAPSFQPHVILLDLGMPTVDGYEAARRIRQQAWSNGVVLVAVTGWGQDEDRAKAKSAGFDFHLTKPAHPETLERLLRDLAASPRGVPKS
jgi:CheY-like chemotaxis protein